VALIKTKRSYLLVERRISNVLVRVPLIRILRNTYLEELTLRGCISNVGVAPRAAENGFMLLVVHSHLRFLGLMKLKHWNLHSVSKSQSLLKGLVGPGELSRDIAGERNVVCADF
jgi:hypothetical protein